MSDSSKSSNVNSSSFASILAGVKRMREEYGGEEQQDKEIVKHARIQKQKEQSQPTPASQQSQPESTTSQPRTKILEKSQPLQRHTLDKPTAKPVPPTKSQPQLRASNNAPRSLGPSEILVARSQEKNPLLKDSMMKNISWKFDAKILSDYYINSTFQILFLSLKYHKLRPEYIWNRLKKLNKGSIVDDEHAKKKNDKNLRILLCVIDIDSYHETIRKLTDFCIKHDLSMVLAWSFEEAGNYIALGKHFDNTPNKVSKSLQGFRKTDYNSNLVDSLTSVKSINKTDVSNLLANYKSFKEIILQNSSSSNLNESEINSITGLGTTKLKNLNSMFTSDFILNKKTN
ncbi:unnamed protein product [Candida verbasci]|uniref:ERCC1-like central domain-containing protein n=1 Tax=Candida verbasci TaxID=1227364 RepID=A0A9W4X9X8_9ASCO|nr:unnamed protein product [Candida verbasci]